MAKIILEAPGGPYSTEIDTKEMAVKLREVFLGVLFVTDSGEELAVAMRDDGFEIRYFSNTPDAEFNSGWMQMNQGIVTKTGLRRS